MSRTAAALREPWRPRAALRRRISAWLQSRLPRTDVLTLTQRNVYILPTGAGLMFGATLVVLLVASINYQLNLGYVLTFLLAGSGLVSMHLTHNTLRGLTLRLKPVVPVFAGEPAALEVVLTSPGTARYGIGLRTDGTPAAGLVWTDVPDAGQSTARLAFTPQQRGRQAVPSLTIETRFPLGLFRAWTVWRPAGLVLTYPRPEQPPAALPGPVPRAGGTVSQRGATAGELEGIRGYRRGDPLKLVVWKKAAKAMASGGDLVSRDASASSQQELWLDWQGCGSLLPEERLCRLASWVSIAERGQPGSAGAAYGLRLPGTELTPSQGESHRRQCLEALALWKENAT